MNGNTLDEEAIFKVACQLASPETRYVYLKQVCGDNSVLAKRMCELLRVHDEEADFLESPPVSRINLPSVDFPAETLGSYIGPYKLIEQIGDGGMGVVYMAAQKEPVRRNVALKVIKAGMDTQQVVARFEAERQAMAMMNHPNIAKVLDAGATDAGRPYFVMELVKGAPITEFCDSHKLDTKHRLQLFIAVCQAVQHAHQKGLIHRDIKPSNVMVEMHDVTPVPKVIDFGVAKAIGHQLTEKTLHSGFHQMVGTPLYMSPEQAGQSSIDIDTRSDIYSLGVLLYEILTGQTPFESEALRTAGYDEMRRMIREVDPPRPSARVSTLEAKVLSTVSNCRNIDARKFSDQLRGELDWIVMKALEKDRSRRYDTANEFADDVQRFLNDEAVLACPPSTFYRFRKLASRNRATLSAATLVAATLVLGTAISVWQAMQAREAKAQTEIAKQQLDARYRIAKEAVDTYLLRVTQDERLNHPSFRQLRRSLLDAALPYYDELLRLAPTDLPSQLARAESLSQLGSIQHEIGNFEQSRLALEESASSLSGLAAAEPRHPAYRQNLANVLVHLAEHYRARGALDDMLAYEQRALELREELVAEQPENETYLLELATSYTNVGVAAHNGEARELLEQAIHIWHTLSDGTPQNSNYRELLSLGYHNLGHHFAWGRVDEAVPFHERGLELRTEFANEQPHSQKAQVYLAQSHQYLADCLIMNKSQFEKAREHRQEAIRILNQYLENHPNAPAVKAQLAAAKNRLGQTLQQLGNLDQGLEDCQSAHAMWRELLADYPGDFEYEVGLASSQYGVGVLLAALKRSDESMGALQLAREGVVATLERIGPYQQGSELLRNIYQSLSDTSRALGMTPDQDSDEEYTKSRKQVAGEALRPSKFLTGLSYPPAHGLRAGVQASIIPQTEEQEQIMKRNQQRYRRPAVEKLEDRSLMAVDISISDASAVEGSDSYRYYDQFVPSGSAALDEPLGLVFRNDDLFVTSGKNNSIVRYEASTGSITPFIHSGDGGLNRPFALAFGPDGKLYVSSTNSNEILRFNGENGTFDKVFVTSGSGGLSWPRGLAFGPDGSLYVASQYSHEVLRFQGPLGENPGAPLNWSASTPTVRNPFGLIFGPDGDLYVSYVPSDLDGTGSNTLGITYVNRYDDVTGSPLPAPGKPGAEYVSQGTAGIVDVRELNFDPDGNLLLSDGGSHRVVRFQGPAGSSPGDFLNVAVSPGLGAISTPRGIAFDMQGNLYVCSGGTDAVLRYNQEIQAAFSVRLSSPSTTMVTVAYATNYGTATSSDFTAAYGTTTFAPGQTSRTILVKSMDDASSESTETFTIILSNPIGAAIADGTGVGTILDNDPFTKFYVVNDASTDRTYEYGTTGSSVENYALNSGNTAPRGAASTAAGDKVWVVDANKSVYAYDTNGILQGSWAAGGLQSSAQLEGIATNGTDVWLVDRTADKVYRYTNAASRTGGSQNAFSSFSLNSGNTNPKDIVTDGTYLWVVDDSSTDKVFKYTVAGTFVGSWRISTSGAKNPTGITLDPSNPSHVWIVDSGTDRVYQYDNSVGLTSGSKSANSSWALAAGNTNPQGIADPPPPTASSVGKAMDFQSPSIGPVPMPWFSGSTANDGSVSLQQVQSKVRTTDEFMSVLGLAFEQPKASVSVGRISTVASSKSIDRSADIDVEIQDHDLDDLIGLVAYDLWR